MNKSEISKTKADEQADDVSVMDTQGQQLLVVDLHRTGLRLLEDLRIVCVGDKQAVRSTSTETASATTIIAEPVEGVRASLRVATMETSSRHGGERHLDGDELVYLLSGSAGVEVRINGSEPQASILTQGQGAVVPRGVWHRIVVRAPSELLFLTQGRTEVMPPPKEPGDR